MDVISPLPEKKIDSQTKLLISRPVRSVKIPAGVIAKVKELVASKNRPADAAVEIGIPYGILRRILEKGSVSQASWDTLTEWYDSLPKKRK